MNIDCKQNAPGVTSSYISVNCHVTKLILTLDDKNILYDFDDYKKLLKYLENFIESEKIQRVKNYICDNCEYINNLVQQEIKNNSSNQLSLF